MLLSMLLLLPAAAGPTSRTVSAFCSSTEQRSPSGSSASTSSRGLHSIFTLPTSAERVPPPAAATITSAPDCSSLRYPVRPAGSCR